MTQSAHNYEGHLSPDPYALETPDGRIAHTLTACTRCRKRKSRCDPGIPRCAPCERSNARCVYYDSARAQTVSRAHIVALREKARALEQELAKAEQEIQHTADAELMVRGAGRIRFSDNDEPRYLGASSGIAMTRLVMEIAKQNTDSKSIKDVVPELTAQEIKAAFAQEDAKPTSKVYPMISSIPSDSLPPRSLTERLIDLFVAKAQALLPTLHIPSFRREAEEVFDGSTDPCHNFQLRMVIAISMQKMSPAFAGLADSFYLAALPFLESTLKRMDLRALQCLVLIAQYSMLTPTRTASYWVVGTAMRMCQDLGFCDEATITQSSHGKPLNPLELDMRRRLFWIVSSMEFGLSHSLGRPSAWSVTHDSVNVQFFELVDDRFITEEGINPHAKPVMAKCIAIHFFKMRILQLEVRRMLYLNRRDTPTHDQDPWFQHMLAKVDHWVETCPKNDDGSGLNVKWFQGRRNTMIILMHRPSPQIPEPSVHAAKICYEAATFNIAMHHEQTFTQSVDLTWIFTQSLFMVFNIVLWTLSYPEIRKEHPIDEVQSYLDMALEVIVHAAERWPGVQSALILYKRLVEACLKAYATEESFVVHSPSNHPTPTSSQEVATPQAMSSPSTSTTTSFHTHPNRAATHSIGDSASAGTVSRGPSVDPPGSYSSATPSYNTPAFTSHPADTSHLSPVTPTYDLQSTIAATDADLQQATPTYCATSGPFSDLSIDPNTPHNAMPSIVPGLQGWDPNFSLASTTASHLAYVDATVDPMQWTLSIGDQYSNYFNEPFPTPSWRERTLSQQEQIELMASLEYNIPDVSAQLGHESYAFYQS
ncbi:Fungal Zn(2)-Cys(6) binuclear cluster domain-containing protein [Penicillium ucsense]|uniref:Fungal Zn(2)-Cys(6) binuclear cluster domain-containing protein n=1 Tax=Penicillium ucsense TaxID=2839758 RepID=A0A8J8VVN1_9EURO|nr:Fungal Zn(2)-Cys(6) binuclear cluster domain-containing protein [Penicillium ucsense]KAF7726947.1 Fungal Zn(2)-Cys(6) binuclear cluster domain-containing protein [Penicillium ucsense]